MQQYTVFICRQLLRSVVVFLYYMSFWQRIEESSRIPIYEHNWIRATIFKSTIGITGTPVSWAPQPIQFHPMPICLYLWEKIWLRWTSKPPKKPISRLIYYAFLYKWMNTIRESLVHTSCDTFNRITSRYASLNHRAMKNESTWGDPTSFRFRIN